MEKQSTNRLFTKENSLTVKGIAILMMLFYHLFSSAKDNFELGVNYRPFSEDVFLMIAGFGNICVAVFVFLSAYGISKKIYDSNEITLKKAYSDSFKRFLKLLFNFAFMFTCINLLWFHWFNYSLAFGEGKQGFLAFLLDGLGFSHLFSTPSLNMTWWYMSLAYTIIFIVPILAVLCKKIGYPFLGLSFLIPFIMPLNEDLAHYFFVIGVGIACAYGNWIEKIINSKIPVWVRWIAEIVLIVLSVIIRDNEFVKTTLICQADAIFAFIIVCFAVDMVSFIPVIRKIFSFLGKFSMNIFFVHTFFYLILYRYYVYHFKRFYITYFILLAVSLILSMVIELLKFLFLKGWKAIFHKKTKQE